MDAVTSFIYGMSMMFFSMMAWMFWRKGSERLFRLIMLLMLIADAQCLKDLVLFYYKGFGSTEGWYFTSAVDMFIIPFYSFVLMELVRPGWTTWTKAVVLELPFVLLPLLFLISGANIYFYILSVWGAVYGVTTFVVLFFLIRRYHRQLKERCNLPDISVAAKHPCRNPSTPSPSAPRQNHRRHTPGCGKSARWYDKLPPPYPPEECSHY